jgi:hypothetical protein
MQGTNKIKEKNALPGSCHCLAGAHEAAEPAVGPDPCVQLWSRAHMAPEPRKAGPPGGNILCVRNLKNIGSCVLVFAVRARGCKKYLTLEIAKFVFNKAFRACSPYIREIKNMALFWNLFVCLSMDWKGQEWANQNGKAWNEL